MNHFRLSLFFILTSGFGLSNLVLSGCECDGPMWWALSTDEVLIEEVKSSGSSAIIGRVIKIQSIDTVLNSKDEKTGFSSVLQKSIYAKISFVIQKQFNNNRLSDTIVINSLSKAYCGVELNLNQIYFISFWTKYNPSGYWINICSTIYNYSKIEKSIPKLEQYISDRTNHAKIYNSLQGVWLNKVDTAYKLYIIDDLMIEAYNHGKYTNTSFSRLKINTITKVGKVNPTVKLLKIRQGLDSKKNDTTILSINDIVNEPKTFVFSKTETPYEYPFKKIEDIPNKEELNDLYFQSNDNIEYCIQQLSRLNDDDCYPVSIYSTISDSLYAKRFKFQYFKAFSQRLKSTHYENREADFMAAHKFVRDSTVRFVKHLSQIHQIDTSYLQFWVDAIWGEIQIANEGEEQLALKKYLDNLTTSSSFNIEENIVLKQLKVKFSSLIVK